MIYPHTATIERLQTVGTKYIFAPVGSTKCFKQPIDETSAQLFGLTFTKGSVLYLPLEADVREADRLTISGTQYGVRGVSSRDYGTLSHKKAVIEEL